MTLRMNRGALALLLLFSFAAAALKSGQNVLEEVGTSEVKTNAISAAGLGMADGLMELLPAARMGHIGLYRDHETKRPVEYYVKLPEPEGRIFILVDPMLATGGSALAALNLLHEQGAKHVRLVNLVAAPEGVRTLHEAHPDVPIIAAAVDRELNSSGYILPGLGDAGENVGVFHQSKNRR